MTFAISPSTSDRTVIFFLFLTFFGSINLKILTLTFYLLRLTFNFKVTHLFTWPLLSHLLQVIEPSSFFESINLKILTLFTDVFNFKGFRSIYKRTVINLKILTDLLPATLDLQLQGHAPFHVTFAISPSTSDRTVIFFLFLTFFGSINLKILSLTFYLLRLTFNFKVTHLFTWQSIPTVSYLPITFHSNNFYNTFEEMVKLFFVFYQCSKDNVISSRTSQYVYQFF